MKETPHTLLFHAAFSYLATVTEQRDPRLSRSMGLRDDQIARLRSMSARSLMLMAMRSKGCLHIQIDPEAFDDLVADVDEELAAVHLRDAFVQQDASREMMSYLFGMTARDYATARSLQGMPPPLGRIRDMTEDEEQTIYEAIDARDEPYKPAELLALAQKVDVPLRVIWEELQTHYPHLVGQPSLQRPDHEKLATANF